MEEEKEKMIHIAIKEICKEEGIALRIFSYGWIYQMKKDGKVAYLCGTRLDLNGAGCSDIACDKYATYEILSSEKIPAVEHQIFFNPVTRSRYSSNLFQGILQYFKTHQEKVVVKAKDGSRGEEVFLCEDIATLEQTVMTLFQEKDAICLCPFYEIEYEYRVFYINAECLYAYRKRKPYIEGDGIHTISQFIKEKALDASIPADTILKKGEKLELSWKFNLSHGATAEEIADSSLLSKLYALAKQAGQAIGISYATVDIIEDKEGNLRVLEINSGVSMTKFVEEQESRYPIAKEIYRKAIKALF